MPDKQKAHGWYVPIGREPEEFYNLPTGENKAVKQIDALARGSKNYNYEPLLPVSDQMTLLKMHSQGMPPEQLRKMISVAKSLKLAEDLRSGVPGSEQYNPVFTKFIRKEDTDELDEFRNERQPISGWKTRAF